MTEASSALTPFGSALIPIRANAIPTGEGVVEETAPDFGVSGISFRVVSIKDSGCDQRLAWLHQGVRQSQEYAYREGDTNFLSVVDRDYDVLIVAGHDVQRMKRIVIRNRVALHRKLKICVMNQSMPADRAQLLMAGYDDVVDIARVPWPEFAARIQAMNARVASAIGRQDAKEQELSRLDKICHMRRLTWREQDILLSLLNARDMCASLMTLRRCISPAGTLVSESHLRVLISQLRHKLFDHVEIINVRGIGYKLLNRARLVGQPD